MGVVIHGDGGLGGDRDRCGGWQAYGTELGGGGMSGVARAFPECDVKTPITQPSRFATLG